MNSINQLIFVVVKHGVFIIVWTESVNITQMSFGFEGLNMLLS